MPGRDSLGPRIGLIGIAPAQPRTPRSAPERVRGFRRVAKLEQEFGKHLRALRRARGLSQYELGKLAALSPDTVRRIEHGSMSASLGTMRKLCTGLGLSLTTLFASFEVGEALDDELADAIRRLPRARRLLALRLVDQLARVDEV